MSTVPGKLNRRTALGAIAAASFASPSSGQKSDLNTMMKPMPETGFEPIFDGKTLDGWDGDPKFWRVEDGSLIGQTTIENQPKQNTFLIWRRGAPENFVVKAEYKLTGFNSGIQYRSIELPNIKWAMKGYQADIDGEQTYTGQIYEERGRGFLALRGQSNFIANGEKPTVVGVLGTNNELKALIHADDWNRMTIIARGNTLLQYINGRLMSSLVDEDDKNRKLKGLIGIQVHKGPAMKIEVRKIAIKNL